MADKPKYDINVQEYLDSAAPGFKFSGFENGKPIATHEDGRVADIDPAQILSSQKLDPGLLGEVTYNTPKTALEKSPLSTADSIRLAFGNEKGGVSYLKGRFPEADVSVDPDKGIVMKQDGAWSRVTPDLLGGGDAWDKTKNAIKLMAFAATRGRLKLLDSDDKNRLAANAAKEAGALPNAVISGATTALGTALGPAGSVAGAALGGALAGKVRTSLGRIVNTYEASPDEELKDIAMESLLTAGGQAVALGAKPTFEMLSKAAKNLKNSLTDAGLMGFSEAIGKLSGVGAANMSVAIEDNPNVIGKITRFASAADGDVGQALELAGKSKVAIVKNMVEEGAKAVPKKYGENLAKLSQAAKGTPLKFNMSEMRDHVFAALEDEVGMGFAKQGEFEIFGPQSVATRISRDKSAELLGDETKKAVQPLLNTLSEFGKIGELRGEPAAKTLTRFQTFLNKQGSKAWDANGANPETQRILAKVSTAYHEYVAKVFNGAGLGKEYAALAEPYLAANDWLDTARSALADKTGKAMETFTARASSGIGKNLTAKGQLGSIVEFLGPRGQELHRDFLATNAAQAFLPRMPKIGMLQAAASGGIGYAALTGGGNATGAALLAAPILTQSSPRFVAREIQAAQSMLPYARQGLDFMKSLGPKQIDLLMRDEAALGTLFRAIGSGPVQEQQLRGQLMNKIQQVVSPQTGEPQ